MSEKSDGKAWGGVFRVPTDQRVESFSRVYLSTNGWLTMILTDR